MEQLGSRNITAFSSVVFHGYLLCLWGGAGNLGDISNKETGVQMSKYLRCVEGRVVKEPGKIEIPSNPHVAAPGEDIESFISEEIVTAFKACGVDITTKDPFEFARSIKLNGVRIDNLCFANAPLKDGLYFYKNGRLKAFVFIPREEAVDMVNYFGDRL